MVSRWTADRPTTCRTWRWRATMSRAPTPSRWRWCSQWETGLDVRASQKAWPSRVRCHLWLLRRYSTFDFHFLKKRRNSVLIGGSVLFLFRVQKLKRFGNGDSAAISPMSTWTIASFVWATLNWSRIYVSFYADMRFTQNVWINGWRLVSGANRGFSWTLHATLDWEWIDWSIDWLVGYSIVRLYGRLIDWLIFLLIDWLFHWLIDWLSHCLLARLIDWLIGHNFFKNSFLLKY